jgi:hypothetical protein
MPQDQDLRVLGGLKGDLRAALRVLDPAGARAASMRSQKPVMSTAGNATEIRHYRRAGAMPGHLTGPA